MIHLPLKPKIVEKTDNRAVFQIEELWPGYGVTVGNSLRRVLLSSLEGAAATEVKITGVQHEFSTIAGVMEDVITLMLNIKQLRFNLFGTEPQKATLVIKGEKKATAADLKTPSQLKVVSKDIHLATLTDKSAKLELEILVEKGFGYVTRESRKDAKTEIGVIPLDSFFTPIRKVSFNVENMRVGDRTDFDRLNLEVETDGTITPEGAFFQAADILVKHFSLLTDAFVPEEAKEEVKEETSPKGAAKTKIEDLGLSARIVKVLTKGGIKTVDGLAGKTEESLLALEGMGEKGIAEIKKALKKEDLKLKDSK